MSDTWVTIIGAVGAGGGVTAFVGYLKERKKDASNAKLTDVQALQAEIVALTDVTKYLREENKQLRQDYVASEAARREMYAEVQELQQELSRVREKAAETQSHCDRLNAQLQNLLGRDAK